MKMRTRYQEKVLLIFKPYIEKHATAKALSQYGSRPPTGRLHTGRIAAAKKDHSPGKLSNREMGEFESPAVRRLR